MKHYNYHFHHYYSQSSITQFSNHHFPDRILVYLPYFSVYNKTKKKSTIIIFLNEKCLQKITSATRACLVRFFYPNIDLELFFSFHFNAFIAKEIKTQFIEQILLALYITFSWQFLGLVFLIAIFFRFRRLTHTTY